MAVNGRGATSFSLWCEWGRLARLENYKPPNKKHEHKSNEWDQVSTRVFEKRRAHNCVCVNVLWLKSHALLQLRPEDDGLHGESDRSGESQVRVQQHREDKRGHPDTLEKDIEEEAVLIKDYITVRNFMTAVKTNKKQNKEKKTPFCSALFRQAFYCSNVWTETLSECY